MIEHRRIEPAEFQRSVAFLTRKIGALSKLNGDLDRDHVDLQDALASLPPVRRNRAGVLLDGIAVQAASENPAMATAARYVRALAQEVWHDPRAANDPALN